MSIYRDPRIDRACAADPKVKRADDHATRLLNILRFLQAEEPENTARHRSVSYAHRAAVLERNRLIQKGLKET